MQMVVPLPDDMGERVFMALRVCDMFPHQPSKKDILLKAVLALPRRASYALYFSCDVGEGLDFSSAALLYFKNYLPECPVVEAEDLMSYNDN